MTNHINVEESFIKSLVENAAWDEARLSVTEAKQEETVEASKEEAEVVEEEKEELVQETQALQEDQHVCPLCESTLEEALTDEQIMEHLAQIEEAFGQDLEEKNGSGGDDDDAVDAALADYEKTDKSKQADKETAASKGSAGEADAQADTDEMMEKKKKAKKKVDAMKERYASKK
jgi:hypothetical protein